MYIYISGLDPSFGDRLLEITLTYLYVCTVQF